MYGALAHFYTHLVFRIASAKLDTHYAIFLRNCKNLLKINEKSAFSVNCANRLSRYFVILHQRTYRTT